MALNDCYTLVWKIRVGSDEGSFRTHWREGAGVQFPHPASVLSATTLSQHGAKLRAILSNQAEISGADVYQWKGDIKPPGETSAWNQVGNVQSNALSAGLCYCFDLIQWTAQQRIRGRCYVPGVPESFTAGNFVTPQAGLLLAVFAAAMSGAITVPPELGGGTFTAVIKHRTNPGASPPIYQPIEVDTFRHSIRLARQRRRIGLNQSLS